MKSLFTVIRAAATSSNGPCPGLQALLGQGRERWETCPVALEKPPWIRCQGGRGWSPREIFLEAATGVEGGT